MTDAAPSTFTIISGNVGAKRTPAVVQDFEQNHVTVRLDRWDSPLPQLIELCGFSQATIYQGNQATLALHIKPVTKVGAVDGQALVIDHSEIQALTVTSDKALATLAITHTKCDKLKVPRAVGTLRITKSTVSLSTPLDAGDVRLDEVQLAIPSETRFGGALFVAGGAIKCDGAASFRKEGVNLGRCSVTGGTIAGSFDLFEAHGSDFEDCNVRFAVRSVIEVTCVHRGTSGYPSWSPQISEQSTLTEVTFNHCAPDTGAIAATCADPSTIKLIECKESDSWEFLRDNFTGPMMALHLGLTSAYVATLLVQVGFFTLSARLGGVAELSGWQKVTVLQLVFFGFAKPLSFLGVLHLFTSLVLLAYNALRAYVTVQVTRLRQREDHKSSQGFSFCRPSRSHYQRLFALARWMVGSTVIVVIIILFKVGDALRLDAWAPIG